VAKDQKIHMKVPLHFVNAEIAPGVKTGGGVVSHVFTELDISCLPDDLPNYIEVDLSELQIGHSIHLSQLKLPKGVESTQLRAGDDFVVATIPIPRAEAEKEDEAEAAAAAAASAPAAAVATPGAAEKGDKDKKEEKKEGDKK